LRVIPEPAPPLAAGAFARLMAPFGPFEASPVVAVAVSGGRDSLALTVLAHDWAAARDGCAIGLIVDHGLRAESAAEAAATRALLARRGIEGAILAWSGPKPTAGLQAAARAARYRLLRDECRRRGILHLLLAHHADDQAETVAMRAARRSGPDGLAGMAALVELPELRLLRPLLGVPRARLTATLQARDVPWLDDPSNSDPRFERARLRIGSLSTPMPVARGAAAQDRAAQDRAAQDRAAQDRAAQDRAARERALARAAVDVLEIDPDGLPIIDRAGFAGLPPELQAGLLSRLVQALAGRDHPPRRDRLQRAVYRLSASTDRGKSGNGQDFTLSACRLMLRQAAESRRLLWIVRPERGRNRGQPLVPAAFFACGGPAAAHLE
jgi:tRNA(Ile)-lysidine synthase